MLRRVHQTRRAACSRTNRSCFPRRAGAAPDESETCRVRRIRPFARESDNNDRSGRSGRSDGLRTNRRKPITRKRPTNKCARDPDDISAFPRLPLHRPLHSAYLPARGRLRITSSSPPSLTLFHCSRESVPPPPARNDDDADGRNIRAKKIFIPFSRPPTSSRNLPRHGQGRVLPCSVTPAAIEGVRAARTEEVTFV